MVLSGNKDYVIIIITILWGIKDLSQPVSVALRNRSNKKKNSVTNSIFQMLKIYIFLK